MPRELISFDGVTRRVFITSSIISGTILVLMPQYSISPIDIKPFKIIQAIQDVLFPKGLEAPSALEFGATNYLLRVSSHSSFVEFDLKFLIYGTNLLIEEERDFLSMNAIDKDKALKNFISKSQKNKNWLSLLLYYTIEALLSDPIYGGNRDELGWRWLGHHSGKPKPQKPFGEIV